MWRVEIIYTIFYRGIQNLLLMDDGNVEVISSCPALSVLSLWSEASENGLGKSVEKDWARKNSQYNNKIFPKKHM